MNTIWSFDLGKASIGEAVRYVTDKANDPLNHTFPHKESLLLPEDFAETRTAASHRRMMRTREAHKAREAWLDAVWCAAGLAPLVGRRVEKREGKWQPVAETPEQETERKEKLEREFPKKGDVACYNSALLRIKLLRGEKLEPWQIYKALHSAIQKRGYGRVPWAAREEKRSGKTEEEMDKELAKKDPIYKAAVEAWPAFKRGLEECFHFPCYFDAAKMKLWNPAAPDVLVERIDCHAGSTRRVRFAREDVEKEIDTLARQAAAQLPALAEMFVRVKRDGWALRDEKSGRTKTFPVVATDIGTFLVHGPAGEPRGGVESDFAAYLAFRTASGIHPGSADDWMGATSQKTPRFDNRIISDCALLDGHQVCNVGVRYDAKNQRPFADSLLASEVTFLMKLKNTLVAGAGKDRKLKVDEIRKIFAVVSADVLALPIKVKPRGKAAAQVLSEEEQTTRGMKTWPKRVAESYALTKHEWANKPGIKELKLFPLTNHEVIKAPKIEGRSRFSRSALRLVRALVLSGDKPGEFKRRLLARDAELLVELGMDVLAAPLPQRAKINGKPEPQRRPYVLERNLKFLTDLAQANVTWDAIHIPEQRLDALEARHTEDGQLQGDAAIGELIGSINDPVVRHRLGVFAARLCELHGRFGVPEEIVLEFVRTDFMGKKAKDALDAFQKKREKDRAIAREQVGKGDALKYELFAAQACACLYCGQPFAASELANYEIEHIVPRTKGGPDAMVNYVLAHRECNTVKGDRTPFEWLRPGGDWDGFVKRVESRATELRNKKVQLLLREDAAELVQRYTALAETAWISRLAQTIAGLHFGWRNGNDKDGVKRVTVISGGLTARVRRKYRLNSILAPCPAGEDSTEWEAKAEKNRGDKRHHALDAMVINFLPQWSRNASKEHFFRFPDPIQKNAQAFFRKEINEVFARNVAFKKPRLADSIYGARDECSIIVHREPVFDLAYNTEKQKPVFDLEYLRDKIKKVRGSRSDENAESTIAGLLERFLKEGNDDPSAWRDFCDNLRLPRRDGTLGPRVMKVTVKAGEPPEYVELSKDKTGAYRKGKKDHRGQIVYLLRTMTKKGVVKETIEVRPVYVFESRATVEKKLKDEHGEAITIYGFFQSGCLIAVEREVAHEKKPLPTGKYLLNTVRAGGDVKLTTQEGRTHPDIPRYSLKALIAAGLRRAD